MPGSLGNPASTEKSRREVWFVLVLTSASASSSRGRTVRFRKSEPIRDRRVLESRRPRVMMPRRGSPERAQSFDATWPLGNPLLANPPPVLHARRANVATVTTRANLVDVGSPLDASVSVKPATKRCSPKVMSPMPSISPSAREPSCVR